FGHRPIVLMGPRNSLTAVLLAAESDEVQRRVPAGLGTAWGFARIVPQDVPQPATDNWPFLYLHSPAVPPVYLRFVVPVVLFSVLVTFLLAPPDSRRRPDLPFFFMRGAFRLLETVR